MIDRIWGAEVADTGKRKLEAKLEWRFQGIIRAKETMYIHA